MEISNAPRETVSGTDDDLSMSVMMEVTSRLYTAVQVRVIHLLNVL